MNKGELIAAVADKAGVSKKEAGEVLDAITETIIKSVSKGDDVQILGFGGFSVLERKARVGRNPSTGEQIKIKPTKTPKFKPGKAFKDAVNKKKKK